MKNFNGSAIYIIGIVLVVIFSLVVFLSIEILRPGLDNALLYGQVFLFAGPTIAGLFAALRANEAKEESSAAKKEAENAKKEAADAKHEAKRVQEAIVINTAKLDVVGGQVDGINTRALANQALISEAAGRREGAETATAAAIRLAAEVAATQAEASRAQAETARALAEKAAEVLRAAAEQNAAIAAAVIAAKAPPKSDKAE